MSANVNRPNGPEQPFDAASCRIVKAAESKLAASQYRAIREVSCQFHKGVLTLLGAVPSFYLKQMAQTAVRGIKGVDQVDNRLIVAPYSEGVSRSNVA